MTVAINRPGHNYYGPLFFMIALTAVVFGIVILVLLIIWLDWQVENLQALCKKKDKPLLQAPKSSRVVSVDVFRGMDLCCMIFANYGAGQYWRALVHATWDGITFSDFAFPMYTWWRFIRYRFVFIQGISLRISISSAFKRNLSEGCSPLKATWKCTLKVLYLSFLKNSVWNVH